MSGAFVIVLGVCRGARQIAFAVLCGIFFLDCRRSEGVVRSAWYAWYVWYERAKNMRSRFKNWNFFFTFLKCAFKRLPTLFARVGRLLFRGIEGLLPSRICARIIFSFRSEKLPLFNSRFRRAFFCGGIGNALRRINLYWRAAAHMGVAALFNGALRRKKRKKRASKNPTAAPPDALGRRYIFLGVAL